VPMLNCGMAFLFPAEFPHNLKAKLCIGIGE
jgi:hypothetical protein